MSTIFLRALTPNSIRSTRAKNACTKLKSAQSDKLDIAKKGAFFLPPFPILEYFRQIPLKEGPRKTGVPRNLLVFLSGKR